MNILIPLADGLEEIEAVTCIDVLRRAGIDVITTGLNNKKIKGSHDIIIEADKKIDEIKAEDFDGIMLPGGMPGTENLKNNKKVLKVINSLYEKNKLVAAICAAPMVLEKAGILKGHNATSYPGFDKEMPSCEYQEERVVIDSNLITARGPGVALEFALAVVSYLAGEEKSSTLKEQMLACC